MVLVRHTHTDVGYTHDPVTVWEMHRRFTDAAICCRTTNRSSPSGRSGRWTSRAGPRRRTSCCRSPFAVPGATARAGVRRVPVPVHDDQLAGTCRDCFTVQRRVDFSNADFGITVACPANPLVQLGGVTSGQDHSDGRPAR